jgi:hypothetical protein
LLIRVFRDRIRTGVFTGLISAAATAGVLVAFGMGQRRPFLAFNVAAHGLFGERARLVTTAHPLITPTGIVLHTLVVMACAIAVTLLAGGRRTLVVGLVAAALVSVLFALNTRVLPSAFRPGYETILSEGQLFFLYLTLASALVVGTRLAHSARE